MFAKQNHYSFCLGRPVKELSCVISVLCIIFILLLPSLGGLVSINLCWRRWMNWTLTLHCWPEISGTVEYNNLQSIISLVKYFKSSVFCLSKPSSLIAGISTEVCADRLMVCPELCKKQPASLPSSGTSIKPNPQLSRRSLQNRFLYAAFHFTLWYTANATYR